ncbi:MAG: HAD hydrolase-like protein [Kiritimatiellae bacterium]|nr:HAD hydrolase-like protein [Kiritimatiellia bacterium]
MNAIFFDLDGTLIDSRRDLINTVNATRADLGLAPLADDAVMACVGNGARYLLEHSIPEAAGRYDEIWPIHKRNYEANMMNTVCLYPAVARTLRELGSRGWLLGVVTNKPNWATREILSRLGILREFAAIVAGGDTVLMKPDAQPLRECAARMRGHRLSSHDIIVGDNWTDIACGNNASVKTVFCTYGFGTPRDTRINHKINRFDELLRICRQEEM